MNITVFGTHDLNTLDQAHAVAKYAKSFALMADGHHGYVMPVGGVAAYDNQVSVVGVGFDIACGNCAIKTDVKLEDISRHKLTVNDIDSNPYYVVSDKKLNKIADEIADTISFGIGRSNLADDAPIDHPLFINPAWNIIPNIGKYRDDLRDKARRQLGTVGSGNHYVDVFVDRADGYLWVGVHFGSRGLGHTIASNFLSLGQGGLWGERGKEIETLLNLSDPLGSDYWELMQLAGQYAYVGREWAANKVMSIFGGTQVDLVHNHHNYAWKETHTIDGELQNVIVIRKGATPAFPYQRGFVGGSMGDDAVIIEGSDETEVSGSIQDAAMFSTVHGAGRVMSRREAAGKWTRSGVQKTVGKITPVMMRDWINTTGVILRGGGLDESPHAYRRLPNVLKDQGNTIKINSVLRPIIVCMAPAKLHDPYKD